MAFPHPKDFKGPGEWVVFVEIYPTARNGVDTPFISRVGNYRTEEGARQGIANDLKAMTNTFGGLIDAPGTSGRTYRIFRSTGWEEIKV